VLRKLTALGGVLGMTVASGATAAAATGPCANQQDTMRAAHAITTIDAAEVQNDRVVVKLRQAMLAADRGAGRAAAVRSDLKKLAAEQRTLAAALRQTHKDSDRYHLYRGALRRCESTRQG
jgi:hypothetical protein